MIDLTSAQITELKTLIQSKLDKDVENEKIADEAMDSGNLDLFLSACDNEFDEEIKCAFNSYGIPLDINSFDTIMSL